MKSKTAQAIVQNGKTNGKAENTIDARLQELREKFQKYIGTPVPEALPISALETIVAKFERKQAEKLDSLKDILSESFVPLAQFAEENSVDAETMYKLSSVLKLSVRHIGDFLKDTADVSTKTIADIGVNANFKQAFEFLVSRVMYIHGQLAEMGIVNDTVEPASDVNLNDVPNRGYTFTSEVTENAEVTK